MNAKRLFVVHIMDRRKYVECSHKSTGTQQVQNLDFKGYAIKTSQFELN